MPILLNIDTATEHASICLSKDAQILGLIGSTEQKNHASFLQPAILRLMSDAGFDLSAIDAVAVTSGPGSYTGLRVGLSSAKGICYALNKPLILVNTLEMMAQALLQHMPAATPATALLRPLIDARRMEVFTALYNTQLEQLEAPHALILNDQSFATEQRTVVCCGSGQAKLKTLHPGPDFRFTEIIPDASNLSPLALKCFIAGDFADLAYSEPLYVKEFFDTSKRI